MRFLSIYKSVETGAPPSQDEMARMGRLIEEGMKAGYLLAVEGCLPSAMGARVRLANGKVSVTDGPFTEAKEVVGGLAILQAIVQGRGDRTGQASSSASPVTASASSGSSSRPTRPRPKTRLLERAEQILTAGPPWWRRASARPTRAGRQVVHPDTGRWCDR